MYLNAQEKPLTAAQDWDGDPESHWLFRAQFTAGVAIHPEAMEVSHECRRLAARMDSEWEGGCFPDAIEPLLWESRLPPTRLVRGLLRTAPICIPISCPERLDQLYWETRLSFAAGNLFAAVCSARGCLELAVTDIAHRLGQLPEPDGSIEYSRNFPVRQRFNMITAPMQDARESAHQIYTRASAVIHNGTIPSDSEALDLVSELRATIEELYRSFSRRITRSDAGDLE